jgi:hypothetical protein
VQALLAANTAQAASWLMQYSGYPFPLLALAGLVLAIGLRQRALVLVAALGAIWLLAVLATGTIVFPRYLLFAMFPCYLLAGYAVEQAAGLASSTVGGRAGLVQAGVGAAGIVLVLAPRAGLAVDAIMDPVHAAIPPDEHFRYVEQWFAVYGLGEVVDYLQAEGRTRPVTVLVPPASRGGQVMVPYGALRSYLRHDPRVRFVEAPSLVDARDLRDLRRPSRDGPTFLLVSGSYTDAMGMPSDVPVYTRRLETNLSKGVPNAREVLRVPRPTEPNWLSLYRLDDAK